MTYTLADLGLGVPANPILLNFVSVFRILFCKICRCRPPWGSGSTVIWPNVTFTMQLQVLYSILLIPQFSNITSIVNVQN